MGKNLWKIMAKVLGRFYDGMNIGVMNNQLYDLAKYSGVLLEWTY